MAYNLPEPAMPILLVFPKDLVKSFVKAHSRKLKDGRRVDIPAHYDKRTRKGSEHAPAHGHNLTHLSQEDQYKFDRMHREQHLLTFYQGHALKNRLAHHQQAIQTLNERAEGFAKQGAHKAATKLRNKAIRLNSAAIRHSRALEKVETATSWLASEKEKRVQGAGMLDTGNADKHHEMYVEKLGSPWKPMKTAYKDGQLLLASEAVNYYDQEIKGVEAGKIVPNPKFDLGAMSPSSLHELSQMIDGMGEQPRRLRVSGRSIKHVEEQRPTIAGHIAANLVEFFAKNPEIYPDHKHPKQHALLVHQGDEKSTGKHYVAAVEVEINGDWVDVVSIMTMPDRTLKKAQELKRAILDGQRPTVKVDSHHLVAPEGTHAAADSSDVQNGTVNSIATNGGKEPWQMNREEFAQHVSEVSGGKWAAGVYSKDGNHEYSMPDAWNPKPFAIGGTTYQWNLDKGIAHNDAVIVTANGKKLGRFVIGGSLGDETRAVKAALGKMREHQKSLHGESPKDQALQAAIDHLAEDSRQKDIPAKEKAEDRALVGKLKEAKGKPDDSPQEEERGGQGQEGQIEKDILDHVIYNADSYAKNGNLLEMAKHIDDYATQGGASDQIYHAVKNAAAAINHLAGTGRLPTEMGLKAKGIKGGKAAELLAKVAAKGWQGSIQDHIDVFYENMADNGPKEGDVDASGLVFHNGRWHREGQDKSDQGQATDGEIIKGLAAMNRVIAGHVNVRNAMNREGIGGVSFYWGTEGNPDKGFKGGKGVAKIIAKRNAEGHQGEDVARMMVEVIGKGKAGDVYGPKDGERVNIRHEGHTAVLSHYRDGEKETWLLTGWKDDEGGKAGVNPSRAYASSPSGIQGVKGASPSANSIAKTPATGDLTQAQIDKIISYETSPYKNKDHEYFKYTTKKGQTLIVAKYDLPTGGTVFDYFFPDGKVRHGGWFPATPDSIKRKFDPAKLVPFDAGLSHSDKRTKRLVKESAVTLTKEEPKLRLAPNGKPSNLNALQHAQVRTPQFKAWFGDWEWAWHQQKIDALPVITADWNPNTDISKIAGERGLQEAGKRYLNDENGEPQERAFPVNENGDRIWVSKSSLRKASSGHAGAQKIRMLPILPQLIQSSHFVAEAPDDKHRGSIAGYRYYVANANVDGKPYYVKLAVRELIDGKGRKKKFYDHEMSEMHEVAGYTSPATLAGADDSPATTSLAFIRHHGWQKFNGKASKVVDENGEPLVVYHSAHGDINSFDTDKARDVGFHFGDMSAANYVSQRNADYYGGGKQNSIPAFLNIKNTLQIEDTNFDPFQFPYALAKQIENGLTEIINPRELYDFADSLDGLRGKQNAAKLAKEKIIDFLETKGIDGLTYQNKKEGSGTSYVAFKPTKIKSAIGNTGAFSPDDNGLTKARTILLAFPKGFLSKSGIKGHLSDSKWM